MTHRNDSVSRLPHSGFLKHLSSYMLRRVRYDSSKLKLKKWHHYTLSLMSHLKVICPQTIWSWAHRLKLHSRVFHIFTTFKRVQNGMKALCWFHYLPRCHGTSLTQLKSGSDGKGGRAVTFFCTHVTFDRHRSFPLTTCGCCWRKTVIEAKNSKT